ncbi:hypothetical protein [Luteimicrobium subarcticum]|uniref:Uncharacterized protein n=1 Tax=Luteimicrobium subarcticum TaxID=620910 RepID=A0A2M8WVV8_9MICO|nr:hypothetical protein [Luteimicrobium subarcticum]PJI95064.1 hypothetical protein CLV34_0917 [Luteimicrobium subarcticum]
MTTSPPGDPQAALSVTPLTAASPAVSPAAPPDADLVPARRRRDVPATVVLLTLQAALAVGASFTGLFIAMAADACSPSSCRFGFVTAGFYVGVLLPWVGVLVAVVLAVARLRAGRPAWWVPVVASVTLLSPVLGSAIASAGVS